MRNALLVLLASTSPVFAAPAVVATDAPARPSPLAWDADVGFLAGAADVGDSGGASIGLATGLAVRYRDIALRGTFDYYRVGDSGNANGDRHGRAMRYGGALRYSFVASHGNEGRMDFWGEAGAGVEHVAWRAGGVVDRPSAEIGLGFGSAFRYGPDRRLVGSFMAIRTFIAPSPMADAMPSCGGPCDRPTKPGNDFTTFFELGFHWGG
jgi:hypothetical protein